MISSRRRFVFQRPLTFILSPSQEERRFVALACEARALQRFSKQRGEVTADAAARPAIAPYQEDSWFETRSLPALARSYPCRFTFYFGNPFPQFLSF